MVCKDDIYAWFKNLNGYKRIDFMCGLLHMCLPCEHRFLGSVLEDLGKKDYHYLRDAEIKSNSPGELSKLTDVNMKWTRSRLNLALALLHCFNKECASVLYNILTSSSSVMEHLLSSPGEYFADLAEEILLLFTMAANHPAFTIDQRLNFCDILIKLQRLVEPHSPQEENLCSQENNSHPQEKACIKDICVRGFHQRTSDKKYELLIQVTWSDDTVREIKKTHQELYDFHAKLIKLFPEEAGAHRQERRIPFLPAYKRQINNRDDFESSILPNIRDYARRLVHLPQRLLECDHVVDFFNGSDATPVSPLGTPREAEVTEEEGYESTSPRQVQSIKEEIYPPSHPGCIQSFTVYNSNMIEALRHPMDHPDLLMHVQSPTAPTVINTVTTGTTNRHTYICSQALPTPHSSPLPSPLPSPHISPSTRPHGSRPTSPSSNQVPESIPAWLKQLRLHKYSDKLSKYSMEELLALTDKDLENEGLTCGARKKLLGEIEKCKKMLSNTNGIIQDSDSCSTCTSPPSPTTHSWHTPPTHRPHLPRSNTHMISPTAIYSNSNASSGETSSSSEYSSPSASPPLRRPSQSIESSGSDENEKDSLRVPLVALPRPDYAPNRRYPYIIPYSENNGHIQKQVIDQRPISNLPGMVNDTRFVAMQPHLPPEEMKLAPDGAVHVINSRTSGYTSDPTPLIPGNYPLPPQNIPSPRPQFKPLPLINPTGPYPVNMSNSIVNNNSNSTSPVPGQLRPPVPEVYQGPHVPHNLQIPLVPMSNVPIDNINKQYMAVHDTNSIPRPNSQPNVGERPLNVPSPSHMNNGSYPPQVMGQLVTDNNVNNKGNTVALSSPNMAYPGAVFHTSVNANMPTTTPPVPYNPSQAQTPPSHTPPSHTPTYSGCSMCGCSGDCNTTVTSTTHAPLTYFRLPQNVPPHLGIFPNVHVPPPYMVPTSNGLINPQHNMPYPPLNFPNGVAPEVLYPFTFMGGHIPPHLVAQMQGVPFIAQCETNQPVNGPKIVKTISCYNCGQSGHGAKECKEPTMDSITHTGHFHLNFRPKTDVEDNR